MRLAWYAGASTAMAASVVLSAFHQRANFYSAMVHLYQSNLSLMILINLVILAYSTFVYSLQRICFGQLRAVEVEQLYERAWFAITETCLAMTIFRDEFGGFFIVMFVALLTGKVWGWIGEGRIEALEQQPPANPRLFHTRLSISLALSLAYDAWLLYYATTTVIAKARPDMMVMFLFEFAVLLVTSLHTALRYTIIMFDAEVTRRQTKDRLDERRRQVRAEREAILRRRAEQNEENEDDSELPDENDVDEMDIEVPGWEAKGQYVLGLDLWTDFTKLCIYAVFFAVLFYLYGLPLHIIRDLFMTVRSFIKRLGALMKYRQAIKDMNRYADATEEDLARENTCIICREDMHVWNAHDPARIERTRPKKLPCGHILHLGCLKSWMERQQVCPTCRRSVVINDAAAAAAAVAGQGQGQGNNNNADGALFRFNERGGAPGDGGVPHPGLPGAHGQAPAPGMANQQPLPPAAGNNGPRAGLRMFNFGPFHVGFAQGAPQDVEEIVRRFGLPPHGAAGHPAHAAHAPHPAHPAAAGVPPAADGLFPAAGPLFGRAPAAAAAAAAPPPPPPTYSSYSSSTSAESISADLRNVEERIERGILELQIASEEVVALRALLLELQRIRTGQAAATVQPEGTGTTTAAVPPSAVHHFTTDIDDAAAGAAIPSGSADLPPGVQIPAGWSLLPLRRFDDDDNDSMPPDAQAEAAATAQSGPSNESGFRTPDEVTPPSSQRAASETTEEPAAAAVASSTSTSTAPAAPAAPTAPPVWGGPAQLFGTPAEAATATTAAHEGVSDETSSSGSEA